MANKRFPDDLTEKTSFVNDDQILMADSASSDAAKNIKLGTIHAKRAEVIVGADTLDANNDFVIVSGTFALTLPDASTVHGKVYNIKFSGIGAVTVTPDAGDTIDGAATYVMNKNDETLSIISYADNWEILESSKDFADVEAITGTDSLDINNDFVTVSGTFTLTLPAISGLAGKKFEIKNIGTGTVTVDGNGSETIDGALTQILNVQYEWLILRAGSTEWHIIG